MHTSKFKQGLTWLFISASLTVVSLGGWLIYGLFLKNNTQPIAVGMVTVTEGTVEDKITGESGILKLDNQRLIKSSTTGTVEQILVKNGAIVKKGQILIRLQDTETQLKLQEVESDLKDKESQISDKYYLLKRAEKKQLELNQESEKLKSSYLKDIESKKQEKLWEIEKGELEFKKKQQAISQAERDLTEARVKLEEDKQLFAKGFISENDVTESEKKVSQSETTLSNAKDELLISKIDLDKQYLDLQNFLISVKENNSEPEQKLKEAQSKFEQSQQEVREAKSALNQVSRELNKLKIQRRKVIEELHKTVITAPDNGVILNIQVKVGDLVEEKGTILLMGNPSQQIVELKLAPLDATRVKLRQQAEVTVIGLESQKLTGKVQQISLLATENESNSNQPSDNVKVTAIVKLDHQLKTNIVSGTPVTVALTVAQRNNVLTIPNEAWQQNDSENFVWLKDSHGKAFKKNVKIGLQGLENIEIISGLKAGETVLLPSAETGLNEGDYVIIK